MKKIKNIAIKRIVIYLCCTFLLSSSFFMSYEVPVYAETTYGDLLRDAVYVAGAAAGIFFSGGTLTPALLIPFIESLAGAGFDVYDYITQDVTAGTTTISADFVNLVLQAYKQYQEENGVKFDGTMEPGENGYYCFPDFKAVMYNLDVQPGSYNYVETREWTNICTRYPCAVLVRNGYWSGVTHDYMGFIIFYNKDLDEFYCGWGNLLYENGVRDEEIIPMSSQQFIDGYFFPTSNDINKTHLRVIYGDGTVSEYDHVKFDSLGSGYMHHSELSYSFSASSSSIPIYQSLAGLKQGLRNGDFSAAYNYGKVPECETPAYTGTYDGGDITVATEKLEGIQDKLDEIDKTDKDIYEKLKELLEWLIGNTGGAGGSVDLTTTNSWLAKIYAKVSQIFDKLSETVSGTPDAVYTKIQETLDEMLVQIKKLKHWTMADTVIDGADAMADWLDFLKDLFSGADDAAEGVVVAISSTMDDAANLMKTKFPFCIPWDVFLIVSFLAEEPQTPVFRLPIKIGRLGIEEYIVVSLEDFEAVSSISRTFLSLLYCYALLNLTMKVFPITKEGGD